MPLTANGNSIITKVNIRRNATEDYKLLQQMYCEGTLVYSAAQTAVHHTLDAQKVQEVVPAEYGEDTHSYVR